MARIGISIYPEHTTPERDRAYMEMAAKYGCSRIFSCLLSVTKSREEICKEFRGQIDFAHRLGMEVILDVAPVVLKRLMMICRFSVRSMRTESVWMRDLTLWQNPL